MDALHASGVDCGALSALAATDPSAVKTKLKELGISSVGSRLKVLNELLSAKTGALGTVRSGTGQVAVSNEPTSASSAPHRRRFVVVHSPAVFIREQPSTTAQSCGTMILGSDFLVEGNETPDGWLKLADADGWVLRDGGVLGLGELLKEMPKRPSDCEQASSVLPPFCVMATDGLCNRLRVVLSFAKIAQERGRELTVDPAVTT